MSNYKYITLADATDLVASIGSKVTTLITGPMGCGKSSILNTLATRFRSEEHTSELQSH